MSGVSHPVEDSRTPVDTIIQRVMQADGGAAAPGQRLVLDGPNTGSEADICSCR